MNNKTVFLITSGAYANAEITSDFGLLPTAFLPVGHKRLIELQLDLIEGFECRKYITLPDDYHLLDRDKELLKKNKIVIHRTNPSLNLAQSLLSFLNNNILNSDEEFYILHGDTCFNTLEQKPDLLYYGLSDLFYKWGHLEDVIDKELNENDFKQAVISGYFTFSNIELFEKELNKSNSFEIALRRYHKKQSFEPHLGGGWLDFGHSNLYYKSKMDLNVTRNFNETIGSTNFIKKVSSNSDKILSEFMWFKQLPENLQMFTPSVWGYEKNEKSAAYNIEFVGAPTLQEKWVFGNLPNFVYYNTIDQVFDFIKKMSEQKFKEFNSSEIRRHFEQLYIRKTEERVQKFSEQLEFDLNKAVTINNNIYPCLSQFVNEVLSVLKNNLYRDSKETYITLMHGDLCFSNILTDTRSNIIKVIDPRGGLDNKFNSKQKIIGDFRYDIAKLGHSLIGNYDFIVTGFYNLKSDLDTYNFEFNLQHKERSALKDYFYKKTEELDVNSSFIKASITNLFISMLSLHSEDKNRQIALLLNAYEFYYNK